MPGKGSDRSTVLTLRVPKALDRKLIREARRRRQTRGQAARALLEAGLHDASDADPAVEAARQSRRVSRRVSEQQTLDFIAEATDLRGWR